MKTSLRRSLAFSMLTLLGVAVNAKKVPSRPPIFGIARVRVCGSYSPNSTAFYQSALGLLPVGHPIDEKETDEFFVSSTTTIEFQSKECSQKPPIEIYLQTPDVDRMRKYLKSQRLHPDGIKTYPGSQAEFSILDPEGHRIGFLQRGVASFKDLNRDSRVSNRLIHAGFVVHDRAVEDKFYKDVLGFHVYWHGGMKDGEDNWVDMQVPDGTDWIEYMLRVSPDASHKTLGVMNHIALGVPDIQAAKEQLIKNGWKGTEEPKIGRDGKWQLNLYDPDETRVELMEFKPTKEPCCSAYTGPHPHP
jgi:catechol 2,3-dioxygenase-like lactoylglutathione lyase family enzyme